jgi:hypothetical protein
MNLNETIEDIIIKGTFRKADFSKTSLNGYMINPGAMDQAIRTIKELMWNAELICDDIRAANKGDYDNFVSRMQARYQFLNEDVYRELYDYGMFATR